MARIRSVHPGLWTDEGFVAVSPLARLLYIGIWNEADDIGCFEWKPVTLKMRLLPVDNADVAELMAELVEAGMLLRYAAGERNYGAVRNFCRFQRPKKPKSVHPTTPEVLKFVASDASGSEPDEPDDDGGSGPRGDEPPRVPKKEELTSAQPKPVPTDAEIAAQMEEGGDKGKRKGEEKGKEEPPYAPLADAPAEPSPTRGPASRGTRLPDDWKPGSEAAQFAIGLGLNVGDMVAEFADYWRAVPGSKGRKLDWDATFRNRCRERAARLIPRLAAPPPAQRRPARNGALELILQAKERGAVIRPLLDDISTEEMGHG